MVCLLPNHLIRGQLLRRCAASVGDMMAVFCPYSKSELEAGIPSRRRARPEAGRTRGAEVDTPYG